MNKKTLLKLINNNIQEIETLIETFSESDVYKMEVKLLHSKLQVLKDEIEILGDLKEVDQPEISQIKKSDTDIEQVEHIKEITEVSASKTETHDEIKEEVIKKTGIEPDEGTQKIEKLIIKSSKPKKERIRKKIERVKKETLIKEDSYFKEPIKESKELPDKEKAELKTTQKKLHEKDKGKSSIVADKFEVTKQSINDLLANSKKTKDLASMLKDKPISDLKKAISINDKIRFTKELFNGKSEKYQNSIETINNCNDLDDALGYLNKSFSWDQDKESFREFLELVYRRFVNQ